jgi:AcrR family transcriptional regulator
MSPSASANPPALTPVQAQVVQALAQGISITAAASAAGVHRSTVHNWLNNQKEFATAVQEAREDYVTILRDELRDLSRIALATVRQLLEDPKTSTGTRAKLALAVLQRPQYATGRSWNLPVPPAALAEEAPAQASSAKAARNRPPAAAVRQNSTKTGPNPPASTDKPAAGMQDAARAKVGRNDPCPCGTGLKFKRCCLGKKPLAPAA